MTKILRKKKATRYDHYDTFSEVYSVSQNKINDNDLKRFNDDKFIGTCIQAFEQMLLIKTE
jgi:hypothetical protein